MVLARISARPSPPCVRRATGERTPQPAVPCTLPSTATCLVPGASKPPDRAHRIPPTRSSYRRAVGAFKGCDQVLWPAIDLRSKPGHYARPSMDVGTFCAQSHVLVVAGKGGVGKTTMSAALAKMAAGAGRSVLIVELEGKSGITAAFGRRGDLGLRRSPAGAGHGRVEGLGPGPAAHTRRCAGGVSRGPRPETGVQAAGPLRDPRRGVDRHPGHP